MTVKIFVAKTSDGKEWAPDYVQEVASLEWMLKKAWPEFHHLPAYYCMVANLRHPSADLVVMTERGLGVLDLKHSAGDISIGADGSWYAGKTRIHAGIHQNPRRQVQNYGEKIRQDLLPWLLPASLKKDPSRWNDFKFQTGICFTNQAARLTSVSQAVADRRAGNALPWESDFSVIAPEGFSGWVRKLRFQVDTGPSRHFEPVRAPATILLSAATKVFGATDWKELIAAMPSGSPYAYLVLEVDGNRQVYNLIRDHSLVGRDPNCDVTLPNVYSRVGKQHCRIVRGVTGTEIEDLKSANGTYVDGQLVTAKSPLRHGSRISLGSAEGSEHGCILRFELAGQSTLKPSSTEVN